MFKKISKRTLLCFLLIISIILPSSVFALRDTDGLNYGYQAKSYTQEIDNFECVNSELQLQIESLLEREQDFEYEAEFIFSESDVLFAFELNDIFEGEFDLNKISKLNSIFGEEFNFKEKAYFFESEFQELYPESLYPIHTAFVVREKQPTNYDTFAIEPFMTAYAMILVSQEWSRVGNQFEFRFQMNTLASFPPRPNRPISRATSEIRVAAVHNASVQQLIHTHTFTNPSYGIWHRTHVNTNTAHFRFTVTLTPQNGTLYPNVATANWLLNRTGNIWSPTWNRTCSLTGLQITPPAANWTRNSNPRPPSYTYRTPYINWVRTNFNPNFTWDNQPIHHIRPLNLGGANALGNLIHLTHAQHTPITSWFAGY